MKEKIEKLKQKTLEEIKKATDHKNLEEIKKEFEEMVLKKLDSTEKLIYSFCFNKEIVL